MSRTTEWMRDWLNSSAPKRTQVELASLAGLGPANVSRWLSLQAKPDQEAIERIAAKIDPAEAQTLALAWLNDHVPPAARQLVAVGAAVDGGEELVESAFPEGMSAELKERLVFFGQLALANPDVRQILNVCYEAAQRALKEE